MSKRSTARLAALPRAAVRWSGHAYRVVITRARFLVIAVWIAGAVLINVLMPAHGGTSDFSNLLPPDSAVIKTQQHIMQRFRVPVTSGTTVVLHQPGGLDFLTRADSWLWALGTTQQALQSQAATTPGEIVAAIPIPTGRSDTTVTYLFASSGTGSPTMVRLAKQYAAHFNNQVAATTYVTGLVPAQDAQANYLNNRLGLFEAASLLLIVGIVALAFRSLLAPLVVITVAAAAYVVYFPVLSKVADVLGFTVPSELEPVLLALLLGIVTDYCVLFFSAYRDQLDQGASAIQGTRAVLRHDGSVVAVAGLTVAAGTIALLVAPFEIFRSLGPALALVVLVGLAACLTLTPALMAVLSWRLFTILPVRRSRRADRSSRPPLDAALVRHITRRGPAIAVATGVVVLLALAAALVGGARLSLSFTAALPSDDPVQQGAAILRKADLRGITAPTEVMLEQDNIASRRLDLARLQIAISQQAGVVKVLGPANVPFQRGQGIVLSQDGDAARFLVIFGSDPLGDRAIDNAKQLQRRLPDLVQADVSGARISVGGQTLVAAEVTQLTLRSLEMTLILALVLELVILLLYLRAVLATVVLLAANALSVAAALGLTTWMFQGLLGQEGLTFYAPFAAAVLLIALGADYNVFAVGSVWEEGRRRPLVDAIRVAVPRASGAITTAGLILALTFAMVAVFPLTTFRQIAFATSVGILLDTLIVRPVLTPALLALLGRAGTWPSRRFTAAAETQHKENEVVRGG